jgi:hypothetical protein
LQAKAKDTARHPIIHKTTHHKALPGPKHQWCQAAKLHLKAKEWNAEKVFFKKEQTLASGLEVKAESKQCFLGEAEPSILAQIMMDSSQTFVYSAGKWGQKKYMPLKIFVKMIKFIKCLECSMPAQCRYKMH